MKFDCEIEIIVYFIVFPYLLCQFDIGTLLFCYQISPPITQDLCYGTKKFKRQISTGKLLSRNILL